MNDDENVMSEGDELEEELDDEGNPKKKGEIGMDDDEEDSEEVE